MTICGSGDRGNTHFKGILKNSDLLKSFYTVEQIRNQLCDFLAYSNSYERVLRNKQ